MTLQTPGTLYLIDLSPIDEDEPRELLVKLLSIDDGFKTVWSYCDQYHITILPEMEKFVNVYPVVVSGHRNRRVVKRRRMCFAQRRHCFLAQLGKLHAIEEAVKLSQRNYCSYHRRQLAKLFEDPKS